MFKAYPEAGGWIKTYTGKQFRPMTPDRALVDIRDIAHALSHLCRYAGHCRSFYSVGQHSVLLSRYVQAKHPDKPILWLAALLHDGTEAYLVDIPKPVKHCFQGYAEAEDRVADEIAAAFGFDPALFLEVKPYDVAILQDELAVLFDPDDFDWNFKCPPLGLVIVPQSPVEAKADFLDRYSEIVAAMGTTCPCKPVAA